MKTIFKTIYYLILVGLISLGLLLIISVFPISNNIKVLSVLSGSMEPKIHKGSIIIIKSFSSYKVGDIVTFGPNTKTEIPTTHRIAEMKVVDGETIYKTKGDANNGEDGKEIKTKDIIGKVLFSIPFVGYAINFVKKPIGWMLIVIIPSVIIIYDEILKIGKEIKKMKKAPRQAEGKQEPPIEKGDDKPRIRI